jgi:hypothetical protein
LADVHQAPHLAAVQRHKHTICLHTRNRGGGRGGGQQAAAGSSAWSACDTSGDVSLNILFCNPKNHWRETPTPFNPLSECCNQMVSFLQPPKPYAVCWPPSPIAIRST